MVQVEIVETGKHFMKGKPIETLAPIKPGLTTPLPKGVISGANTSLQPGPSKQEERFLLLSFVFIIIALLMKLTWVVLNIFLWREPL